MPVKCAKCNRNVNVRLESYISCKKCKSNFHLTCSGFADEDYEKLIEQDKLSTWVCNFCKSNNTMQNAAGVDLTPKDGNSEDLRRNNINLPVDQFTKLVEAIVQCQVVPLKEQVAELVNEVQKLSTQNLQLQSEISKLSKSIEKNNTQESEHNQEVLNVKTTYAECIAKNSQNKVIVKPKDKTQNVSKTKSDILNNVNPIESSLVIGKVKNLKDGGLLLGCEDVSKFKEIVKEKLSQNYNVREVKKIRSRIRIAGISDTIQKEDVLSYLVKQNEFIFDNDTTEYEMLKFYPVKKKRNLSRL
ncbi:hypothetical protein Zmor_011690 [Zophobas morio]|uniref:PHD-type domain-containing protein n=1 Tax=Zophobas morio TaxID=2755281 RepID=A0AA38IRS4_9CUCU|nr:hypothetical protein Zmor_011690 [Zophobas morio]